MWYDYLKKSIIKHINITYTIYLVLICFIYILLMFANEIILIDSKSCQSCQLAVRFKCRNPANDALANFTSVRASAVVSCLACAFFLPSVYIFRFQLSLFRLMWLFYKWNCDFEIPCDIKWPDGVRVWWLFKWSV